MKFVLIPLSLALTIAGVTRPEFAGRGIQLLVACTVVGVVGSLVGGRWSGSEARTARPFIAPEPTSTSGTETSDVTELVRMIEGSAGRLPPTIANHLADACRGRLADHHRLYVHSTADHQQIRTLIGPTMWSLVNAQPDDAIDLPIRILPRLLDEVDAL